MTNDPPLDPRTSVGTGSPAIGTFEQFNGLPELPAIMELRQHRQWVSWKEEVRAGSAKPTKPPISPHTGRYASHSAPKDWGTYDAAVARSKKDGLPGIGFVLTEADDITGIDLDHCIRPDGTLEPWAAEIVALGETYTEVSPSGTGLRMLVRGKVPASVKADLIGIEIYRDLRYLTITGWHMRGTPTAIRPAPKTLAALHARLEPWKQEKASAGVPASPARPGEARGAIVAFQVGGGSNFFRNVNSAALKALDRWVPDLFPGARFQPNTGAYRVSSRDLGRGLQEDLSLSPIGIKDFGVHDMGDLRSGKRLPIDIVLAHVSGISNAKAAAHWLCDRLGVQPSELGWIEHGGDAFGAQIAEAISLGRAGLTARLPAIASSGSMDEAASIWTAAAEPRGTAVEKYLASRGLAVPSDVRWVEHCPFADTHSGAMVALITDVKSGAPQGIHLTALTPDGRQNEVVGEARRSLGAVKDGVVRLWADEDVTLALGVAEGIETALSINRLAAYVRLPVWATLDTAGLASFPVLAGVETLVIAVDHHLAGVSAAIDLRNAWTAADREVFTILPRRGINLNHVVQEFDRAA